VLLPRPWLALRFVRCRRPAAPEAEFTKRLASERGAFNVSTSRRYQHHAMQTDGCSGPRLRSKIGLLANPANRPDLIARVVDDGLPICESPLVQNQQARGNPTTGRLQFESASALCGARRGVGMTR